jgi:hypothetical protein
VVTLGEETYLLETFLSVSFLPQRCYCDPVPMARQDKTVTARQCLSAELASIAADIRHQYGPDIGWEEIQTLLRDPHFTPFPCEIRFDSAPLLPGEFGHAVPRGSTREEGFIIYLHPRFASQLSRVSYLVLHQLVLINYGDAATADDAETFGSVALGLSKDAYYRALCDLACQIDGGDELV